MQIKPSDSEQLRALLIEACKTFDALGNHLPWGSKQTGHEIALFVRSCVRDLAIGEISTENIRRLWLTFAPTTDWDDAGGDPDLGNQIFELIEKLGIKPPFK